MCRCRRTRDETKTIRNVSSKQTPPSSSFADDATGFQKRQSTSHAKPQSPNLSRSTALVVSHDDNHRDAWKTRGLGRIEWKTYFLFFLHGFCLPPVARRLCKLSREIPASLERIWGQRRRSRRYGLAHAARISFVRSFARGTRGGVIFFTTPRRRRASRIASSSSLRTHGSRASSKGGSDESRRGEERSRGRRVGVSECPRNSYCGYLFIIFYTFVSFVHACRFFLFTRWMVFEGVLIRDRRGCGRRAPASVGDGRTSGTGRRADDDGGAG